VRPNYNGDGYIDKQRVGAPLAKSSILIDGID